MSETSEYILGQVRAMRCINRNVREAIVCHDFELAKAYTEQLEQEFHFLRAMLERHPPHTLTRLEEDGTIYMGDDSEERRPG